jgi:hypothetical protein
MFLSPVECSVSSSDKSVGERLKKAISEPLANPDKMSSTAARTAANKTPNVSGLTVTSEKELLNEAKSKI